MLLKTIIFISGWDCLTLAGLSKLVFSKSKLTTLDILQNINK